MHSHRCENCGTVWQHDEDPEPAIKAHSCPRCGIVMEYFGGYLIYTGLKLPTFTNHHLLEPGQRDLAANIVDEEPYF